VCTLSFTFLEHLATRYQLEKNDSKCINICSDRNYAIFSILRCQVPEEHDKKILAFSEIQEQKGIIKWKSE
jgi:hypothetical protein